MYKTYYYHCEYVSYFIDFDKNTAKYYQHGDCGAPADHMLINKLMIL